jgi:hypothetical protein
MKEQVTISKEEYDELLYARKKLYALERSGVDNWQWYDVAMEEMDNEDL